MVQRKIAGAASSLMSAAGSIMSAASIASRRAGVVACRPGMVRRAVAAAACHGVALVALAGAAIATTACQNPECEAARLELERTWETLRDTATSRKQIPEGLSLSAGEEQDRIRIWSTIEERAELVRSSFETTQVTWPSADKARADLGTAFKPLAAREDPMTRGFSLKLSEADQHMASFRKSCR